MLRYALGAFLLLSGAHAEDVTADLSVVEDFDFDARQLNAASSTDAPTAKVAVSGKVTLPKMSLEAGTTNAQLLSDAKYANLRTASKASVAAGLTGVTAADVTITGFTVAFTTRRQLAKGRSLAAAEATLGVLFTAQVPQANSAAAATALAPGGSFAAAFATQLKAEQQSNATAWTTMGVTAANVVPSQAGSEVITVSSSGASSVGPSAVLSLCFVAFVALKF